MRRTQVWGGEPHMQQKNCFPLALKKKWDWGGGEQNKPFLRGGGRLIEWGKACGWGGTKKRSQHWLVWGWIYGENPKEKNQGDPTKIKEPCRKIAKLKKKDGGW